MELTKAHRQALLVKLAEAKKAAETASDRVHNKSQIEEDIMFFEIDHYLAKEQIKIIEAALVENAIDY